MKGYLGILVVIVGVAAGSVFAYRAYQKKSLEADRGASMSRIRQDYMERVGWIRSNPDEKSYKDEVNTFLRNYFKEVNAHLDRFGGNKDFDDYLQELERRTEKKGKDVNVAGGKAAWESTKKVFDLLRSGNYAPMWSATDKGLRLDVVSGDVKVVGGRPQIQLFLILWGAQRELREESRSVRRMVTSASFSANWRMFDDKGKLLYEMPVQGDPNGKIDWPERFIAEFPPQMYFGTYPADLIPADVTKLEIAFTVASRSNSGGEAQASYLWKLDTPLEWKLKPGEKWEGATESVRAEEEIDPAKRK